ncbi:Vacuolar protein sorting-associated protein 29 [Frankliniella fusca]|uniref:Vacuolar protein sorting-associated protein 29 n=1 Tax=Frankliniella fusca TaxID=407009 RepID=A0AAE1HXH2_9NEOP|nr:Vacuolar protein sorting-associated protein 29 [Frankliniella fusca]
MAQTRRLPLLVVDAARCVKRSLELAEYDLEGKWSRPWGRRLPVDVIVQQHQHILNMLHANNDIFARPIMERLAITYTLLGLTAYCLSTVSTVKCLQRIEIKLNLGTIYKRVEATSCSCKAGESEKCNHCIALLMFLNRVDDAADLEDLSCTNLTQQWGKLKTAALSQFEAIPLTDFCHFVAPQAIYAKGEPEVSQDLAAELSNLIVQGDAKSEIFLHSSGARPTASSKNCEPDNVTTEKQKKRWDAGRLTERLLTKEKAPCFQQLVALSKITTGILTGWPGNLLAGF